MSRDDDNLEWFQALKRPPCWHDDVQLQQSILSLCSVLNEKLTSHLPWALLRGSEMTVMIILFISLNSVECWIAGIGTKTYWYPLDWFGYLHELCINIWFTSSSLTDGVCHVYSYVLRCLMMVKRMAYGGLPFPGTSFPVQDVVNIHLIWNV